MTNSSVATRGELPSDRSAVAALITAAFAGRPYASGTEARMAEKLWNSGAGFSLVATMAGAVVGHIAFSPITVDGREIGWHALGPVAVVPSAQRQGVGSRLIVDGLARLRDLGTRGCVLIGDRKYYARFGFRHEPAFVPDQHPEHSMLMVLAGDVPTGTYRFHPVFYEP